jgi:chemotaxis protein methyltransferase CheR
MASDYESFKKKVLELTTIDLNAYKERQMKRRIDTLIARNKFTDYDSYVDELKHNQKVFDEFVNYLTINVSEFYRNPHMWDILEKDIFPQLIAMHGNNLKIWSSACSTGDEPYSLVMLLSKQVPLNRIKVIATDIDKQVLEKAKTGIYSAQSISALPEEFKKKYFTQIGSSFKIADEIKRCVEFKSHNLLKDEYPKDCHLIVCRNVVIYFTEEAKREIYEKFYKSLVPGGMLFVGSTEQIIDYKEIGFTSPKLFFYEKPQ